MLSPWSLFDASLYVSPYFEGLFLSCSCWIIIYDLCILCLFFSFFIFEHKFAHFLLEKKSCFVYILFLLLFIWKAIFWSSNAHCRDIAVIKNNIETGFMNVAVNERMQKIRNNITFRLKKLIFFNNTRLIFFVHSAA